MPNSREGAEKEEYCSWACDKFQMTMFSNINTSFMDMSSLTKVTRILPVPMQSLNHGYLKKTYIYK